MDQNLEWIIKEGDNYVCPICGDQLYLVESSAYGMFYKGRADKILNFKELRCVNCSIDFSNQLIFDPDSGHLKFANKEYDLVLVDVDKRISVEDKSAILQVSDAVVITFKQGLEEIEEIKQLREQYPDKKKTNIMFMMGKYDFDSKYNTKNITRMLKETKEISAVPYNIGFYEASMEGKVADFFLNNRTLNDSSSANAKFLQECKRGCDNILAKLEDLKMRM